MCRLVRVAASDRDTVLVRVGVRMLFENSIV